MKKININIINQAHFIGCWNLENNDLCKNIIQLFENNKTMQNKGAMSGSYKPKKKKNNRYYNKSKGFRKSKVRYTKKIYR